MTDHEGHGKQSNPAHLLEAAEMIELSAGGALAPVLGILLAAGNGRRLGLGAKALLPYDGRTLVENHAQVLAAAGCRRVIVVLGAEAERVCQSCQLDAYTVIKNQLWCSGMASSFQAGVAAAAGAGTVVVMLVDQPRVGAPLVRQLLAAHRPGRITVAAYGADQHRGHPIVFDYGHAAAAAANARGDEGGRQYLTAHPELIDSVDCSDWGSPEDIDGKEDLHLLN